MINVGALVNATSLLKGQGDRELDRVNVLNSLYYYYPFVYSLTTDYTSEYYVGG